MSTAAARMRPWGRTPPSAREDATVLWRGHRVSLYSTLCSDSSFTPQYIGVSHGRGDIMGLVKQMQLEQMEHERVHCEACNMPRRGECERCGEPTCLECEGKGCSACAAR